MDNNAISTAYVPLQPPYQIIKYGHLLGMQIGTLIVTIRSQRSGNTYAIDTHSHPVVAYENKDVQKNIQLSGHQIMEGTVWNRVELKDVTTVCLSGCPLPWKEFVDFLWDDAVRFDDIDPFRHRIYWQLKNLGVKLIQPTSVDPDIHLRIYKDPQGVETVCSDREDWLPVRIPWSENSEEIIATLYRIVVGVETIVKDIAPSSSGILTPHFVSDEEKLKEVVEKLNTHRRVVVSGAPFIIRAVEKYEGSPTEE